MENVPENIEQADTFSRNGKVPSSYHATMRGRGDVVISPDKRTGFVQDIITASISSVGKRELTKVQSS
jgi:hypothetical protein